MISYMFPLLTKPLREWTPEEYKIYIRGLYYKPPPKKSAAKKKRLRDYALTVRALKKGGLSITTKRDPRYITKDEYAALSQTHPENELFIALKRAEIHVYENHEEAEKIKADRTEFPW